MNIGRILRHLASPPWAVRTAFPAQTLADIEAAIRASEARHQGELRFAVEGAMDVLPLLRGQTPRERAIEVFAQLGVWDTEANCGVLIYVQLVDHDVEVVADRGISACVSHAEWEDICHRMEQAFRARRFREGALEAIERVTALLARHFPPGGVNVNELSDRPTLL